jgi:hypothetical protein
MYGEQYGITDGVQSANVLVIQLAVEWQANGLQKQTRILVVGRICLDGDVASRYHLWRVSGHG